MSDIRDEEPRASDGTSGQDAASDMGEQGEASQESSSQEAWAPATDAGVPGNDPEERPRPRPPAGPARGGDAPLRRRPERPRPGRSAAPVAEAATEPAEPTPEGERIAKTIARAGIASRRDAEAMIEAGRVTLNGERLTSPAINVTDADRITVDGEPLPARERTRLWIFHKPRGVVTTARDPEGRQTVFEVLPDDLPRVVAIGRLDITTEGLLLLTNDGGLAKVIAHPDTGWLRRYRVRAFGEVTQPELDRLRKGVTIDGMEYGAIEATLDRAQGDNLWLTLGLREGKNREVKRILEHLGLSVNRLIRLSFGPFQLGDLEVGLVEEIRTKVLKEQLGPGLSEQAGVDFTSPAREPIAPFGSPKKAAGPAARQGASSARGAARDRGERTASRAGRDDHAERPARNAARPVRPAVPARVPTGGSGAGPRRSVWHAEDGAGRTEGPHRPKVPRRGADPKTAREAASERGRERVGAIATGERRVLVERLKASPQEPAPEPHRRTKFHSRDTEAGGRPAPRAALPPGDAPPARGERESRPPRREGGTAPGRGRFEGRGASERHGPPRGEARGDGERPRGKAGPRPFEGGQRDRPAPGGGSAGRGERPSGGFRRGSQGENPKGPRGFKPGGKPGAEKFGGRPGGERNAAGRSDRPGGGFKGGAKPGGFKAGGKPGAGGRPGPRGGNRPPPRGGR